jgi:N-dimethylarginine dimethylaminohydrolase
MHRLEGNLLWNGVMLVGAERVVYCRGLIPEESLRGFEMIGILCGGPTTANIICLGKDEVIVERTNREVARQLTGHGVTVHQLALSEFVKGGGGPNCLILPVARR